MAPMYGLPRRYYPIFEEGRRTAREERLRNPDARTVLLDELAQRRKKRDRLLKIQRTMQIARMRTAQRRGSASSPSRAAAS